jgi:uncharacterized protein YaiE (UPF0345 family)
MIAFRYEIINDSLNNALLNGYVGQRVAINDYTPMPDHILVIDKDGNTFQVDEFDLSECFIKEVIPYHYQPYINFSQPVDMLVGDPDQSLSVTSISPAAITFVSSDTSKVTIVSGKLHAVATGSVTITASQAAYGTQYLAAADVSLTVNVVIQAVISFTQPTTLAVGASNETLIATSNSSAAITFTSSDTSVATIVSGAIHAVAPGAVWIIASQAATGGYTAAVDVYKSVIITT